MDNHFTQLIAMSGAVEVGFYIMKYIGSKHLHNTREFLDANYGINPRIDSRVRRYDVGAMLPTPIDLVYWSSLGLIDKLRTKKSQRQETMSQHTTGENAPLNINQSSRGNLDIIDSPIEIHNR